MNFELTDEQQQLADSLRKYLGNAYDFEKRKAILNSPSGVNEKVWATFAELGLTAMTLPEADGGFGGGAVDLMAVMQACGEALVVEPLLDNIGLAGRLLAKAGNEAQRSAWLPGLADGSVQLAFASSEPGHRYDLTPQTTTATSTADGWLLNGEKIVVIGAPTATRLIVSANNGNGTSLFLVDPQAAGVTLKAYRTVDGIRAADIHFSHVKLGADALLGTAGEALPLVEEAVDFATALLCAEAVGAMQFACDATLEYLKTRKQFGVAIGSFQALQHRMVDMVVATEEARSMAILAAAKADDASLTPTERARAISAAKVKIAEAAKLVREESVQLHGGMGMTEELKVSHTFRRLTMASQRFGDADHHLERYAALA
ncbi:acyl-CoA dehydrogenase [Piscinibacter gummiphilus]|uniref:Acyl-CoA dehydrogenase n=1 Tax=Piscinibacter gummiphilus TaxID=946333 RepID=A0ABZ0CRT3_9BURK|nr:acyl-CoA dehydrogenase [Piscinibacter gummiphilus]WOB07568.1 acyl-CoA dehydrogenase [Piscinibacter gummiphilus]